MRSQLEPLFPGIQGQYQTVKRQLETLKNQRQEIESADQEELRSVREEISIVGEGLELRKREIETREREIVELSSEETELRKRIEECRVKIDRAERIKELNRGFEKNEVEEFKGNTSLPSSPHTTALRIPGTGADVLVNLRCLQDVSGWEIKRVDGTNVKMSFRNEIDVSFNINQLSQGNSAIIEPPSNIDPIQQFMFSSLTPQILKGDIKTVPAPI